MRTPAIFLATAIAASHARSEPLSPADREALISSLEALHESADAKVDARFRMAIGAYRQAMGSNEAVMDFYLKCIEKVNFEDQLKKSADFREWKRRETDLLSDANFRLALRYQLRWLVITLEAASAKADQEALAVKAREIVDAIFADITKLADQEQILRQGVTGTVFARAYDIGNLNKVEWPMAPIPSQQVYDQVIFPTLRTPARLDSLRSAWVQRIQQQGLEEETWSGNGKNRRNPELQSLQAARFATDTLPELQWQMEMDLFSNGDESGAAKRMLAHISKYLDHKKARDWSKQFKSLLGPPASATPTASMGSPPGA